MSNPTTPAPSSPRAPRKKIAMRGELRNQMAGESVVNNSEAELGANPSQPLNTTDSDKEPIMPDEQATSPIAKNPIPTAHTPGPWEWHHQNQYLKSWTGQKYKTVLFITYAENGYAKIGVSDDDARLIAAAPALLAALKFYATESAYFLQPDDECLAIKADNGAKARAAIAKAEWRMP